MEQDGQGDKGKQEACVKRLQECYAWRGHLSAAQEMPTNELVASPELLEALICARAKCSPDTDKVSEAFREWLELEEVVSSRQCITDQTDSLITGMRDAILKTLRESTANWRPG